MAVRIGVVSQKGGVGKSTIARLIAREYAANGWRVKIADMDVAQGTSTEWNARRLAANLPAEVAAEQFRTVARALEQDDRYDLLVFDGAPHSNAQTLEIARAADLVLLPTGLALDDLRPTVRLAHELKAAGIPPARIAFVLCRAGDSAAELSEVRAYIETAGYTLLEPALPEKALYRRALDQGRAPTETGRSSLDQKADALAQAIILRISEISNS